MSIADLFWLFFMFSALQPMLRQRMLEAMRVRKIAQLESERKSRVILLVHRQETMRLLGFPIARYIDINDSEEVLRAIQMTDDDVPLDLVLHTPGGLVLAALQIAKAVRDHKAKVTVFVPHYAMSGGTLIALAADEIVMCGHSVLGPIDPQIGQSPAASLIKVVEEKPVARIDDQTLILADVGRKAISQLKQSASELLQRRLPAEQANALAEKLSCGIWTHDYPLWASTVKALGLSVSTAMPNEVLELMKLYPQPVRMQSGSGGGEYLPVARHREGASREVRPDNGLKHWRLGGNEIQQSVKQENAMTIRKLDKKQWRPFFDFVSKMMQGKQAEIEVTSLQLGDQIEAEWLPTHGLAYDPRDDVVEVALEGLDHLIPSPREIYVDDGGELLASVEIVDATGNKQILKLKDELRLPAPQT